MSREIKFRLWDEFTNSYVEVTLSEAFMSSPLVIDGRYEVEQYTGLKDKNDKEIYEGDIVKYKLYADSRLDYIDEVFYSTISGAFMVGDEDNIRTLDCLINVEVSGNIHENPELLGGKK